VLLPGVRPDRLGAEVRSGSSRTGLYVSDDGAVRIEVKRRGEALRAESSGRFTVLPDESDLATLEAGERFDLRERRDGLTHEYHVTASASGQLTRRYARDGEMRAIDGMARAWRAEAIARMYRESGHDAAARVERLLTAGGDEKVFDELEASASDLARVALLKAYVRSPEARREERERVLALVARLDSDRDRAEVLLALIAAPGADAALFNRIRDLRSGLSDSEYRRVIEAIAQAEQAAR
jgi:hypothetical protein